jgi:hypothetical protein
LKLYSFYNFIDLLKESTKYYSDYCNLKNINIIEFDNEYNINILKSELLKYYIFITNNNDSDGTIKDIHEYMQAQSILRFYTSQSEQLDCYLCGIDTSNTSKFDNNKYELNSYHTIPDLDQDFINSININYLTRNKLSKLIHIYFVTAIILESKEFLNPEIKCYDYKKNFIYK